MAERVLMKGNEAIAEAAIRAGCRHYFGYPITPQTEVAAYMAKMMPKVGGTYLQAESEVAAINMVYGAAAAGARVMTSSPAPGISLKSEGISYMAGADLPGVIINVQRGGPGLGSIQPSQADYWQATKATGHGDFQILVFAPSTVQEMADFVGLGFDLAFKYRTPSMILADGIVGQMMEKVVLPPQRPRRTEAELREQCPWAVTGREGGRKRNIVTSLELDSAMMEKNNERFQRTYREIERNEVRYEAKYTEDADYLIVAFGSIARICQKAIDDARKQGIKVGLIRPITLWPFPYDAIREAAKNVKGILCVEINAGQMIEDVRLAVSDSVPVTHFGRMGGIVPNPQEVLDALEKDFIKPSDTPKA